MAGKGKPGPESRITEHSLRVYEQGLAWGWSAASALRYAGICESSFYEFQKRHPELRARYALIKERPYLVARRLIVEAIEAGDIEAAKWYLERRSPEFRLQPKRVLAASSEPSEDVVREQLVRLVEKARRKGLVEG